MGLKLRGSFSHYRREAERAARDQYGLVLSEIVSETELISSFNVGEEIPKELVDRFASEKNLRPITEC